MAFKDNSNLFLVVKLQTQKDTEGVFLSQLPPLLKHCGDSRTHQPPWHCLEQTAQVNLAHTLWMHPCHLAGQPAWSREEQAASPQTPALAQVKGSLQRAFTLRGVQSGEEICQSSLPLGQA